jgi:TatD DNase family protein
MYDAHCHINDFQFDADLTDVLERAKDAGVLGIVDSALNADEIEKSLRISEENPGFVFTAAGLHPENVNPEEFERVVRLVREHKDRIVALGEVGLDYWWVKEETDREIQREHFKQFIALSKELDKPLIVHSRSAGKYAIDMLIEANAKKVLMHAFDGKAGHALRGAEFGFNFSVPTSVIRSEQKIKLAKLVPLERLLLETDSPVLGPDKKERNEPANLPLVARTIAELKRIDVEEVIGITRENTEKFFNFWKMMEMDLPSL